MQLKICTCAPPILYFDQIYFWGFPWHNMDLAVYTNVYVKRGSHLHLVSVSPLKPLEGIS